MRAGKHRADVPVREGYAFIFGKHEKPIPTTQAFLNLLARRTERLAGVR